MAAESLNCWHCGASLGGMPLPLGRREECPACASSLHVCRMCGFYDRNVSKDCREPMADEVTDKEAANFCDYFRPRAGLTAGEDRAAAESRAKLAHLFGEESAPGESDPAAGERESPEAEASRRKLDSLFGDPKD